jgi:hypothetical protein
MSMSRPDRVEGYAIISADGMLADAAGVMPPSLKIEADQRFFHGSLDKASAVVHGRHSHEGGANAPARPRLIVTRRVPGLARHPDNPRAVLWNPCRRLFCRSLENARGRRRGAGGDRRHGDLRDFPRYRL